MNVVAGIALVIALLITGTATAAPEDEIKATFDRFVVAQNAHDISAVRELLLDSPSFLWITRGVPIWGRDAALKKFEAYYQGTWKLNPDVSNMKVMLLSDTTAQLFVPIMFNIGAAAQPAPDAPVLMNQTLIKTQSGWRVASILPIPVLAVLLGPSASASVQGTDPVSVIEGFVSALNAGNEDAAMAFYANDAVRTRVPSPIPGTSGIYTGTDEIRKDLKTQLAGHIQIKNSNYQVTGDKVTWTAKFSNDALNKLGISPLDAVGEATAVGGKIRTHITTLTPESLAKQKAAQATQSRNP